MKEMYLTFNSFTNCYVYYEQKLKETPWKNRREIGKGGTLTDRLSFIDRKRKSILYLINFPDEGLEKIKNFFKNSKILVKVGKRA